MQTMILTRDWPTVYHPCIDGTVVCARFKGACKDGSETECHLCGQTFRYEKPKARRDDVQPQSGRTHF